MRRTGQSVRGPLILSPMAQTRSIPGPAGRLRLRLFVPETIIGVYLHLHGGGWVVGGADEQDVYLEDMARACEVAVASVDYRLAPEHPYPAAPDDCEAAAAWLVEHAAAEFGTDRLIIGGESAGAHLAVATLLRLRDRHAFIGFSGANLAYGLYDLALTPSARHWGQRQLILNTPQIQWFIRHFAPPDVRDPDVSPLQADLSRMPPALFSVGTLDPLLDDSLFMSLRWLAAGNVSEIAVYPGGVHGFNLLALNLARRANQKMFEFIRARASHPG